MDIHIFVFFPKEISREKDENMNICTPLSNNALVTDLYGNAYENPSFFQWRFYNARAIKIYSCSNLFKFEKGQNTENFTHFVSLRIKFMKIDMCHKKSVKYKKTLHSCR